MIRFNSRTIILFVALAAGIIIVVMIVFSIRAGFSYINNDNNSVQQPSPQDTYAWSTENVSTQQGSLPLSESAPSFAYPGASFAYITNDNDNGKLKHGSISFINTANDTVTATVYVGTDPYGVTVSPSGTKVYVTDYKANNVLIIDTATGTLNDSVPVENMPVGIAVTPDGNRLYVANSGSNSVSIIATSTNEVVRTLNGFNDPFGVAVTSDGKKAYVTNSGSSTVSVIDTDTYQVSSVQGIDSPGGIAITQDGKKVYVTSGRTNTAYVIDTLAKKIVNVTVGSNPKGIAISPDGKKVYVTNDGGIKNSSISVIDTTTNKVIDTVKLVDGCYGIAVTPDGKKVYTASRECGAVFILDTTTGKVDPVPVKTNPKAFGQFIGTYSSLASPTTPPTQGESITSKSTMSTKSTQ